MLTVQYIITGEILSFIWDTTKVLIYWPIGSSSKRFLDIGKWMDEGYHYISKLDENLVQYPSNNISIFRYLPF